MKIILTFDYEIFFGSEAGTVKKTIVDPVEALLSISKKYDIKYSFFIDAGYLQKLKTCQKKYRSCEYDYSMNLRVLEGLCQNGHDIQLHVHPHWEDSYYGKNGWQFKLERYRLQDYSHKEINNIITCYKEVLTSIVGYQILAFRAGGWCIQPFNKIKEALRENEIWIDSTVFKGGNDSTSTHYYDFKSAPDKTIWKFEDDPLIEDKNGFFTELPISSITLEPLFYWKFAVSKIFKKQFNKNSGDGSPLEKSTKKKIKMLLEGDRSVVSTDGYKASILLRALEKYERKYSKNDFFITIGHPKACTAFSIMELEKFIAVNIDKHEFICYKNLL